MLLAGATQNHTFFPILQITLQLNVTQPLGVRGREIGEGELAQWV